MSQTLFGRSDVHSTNGIPGCGHGLDFTKKRLPAPGYGDENRTVAVHTTDCTDCIAFLKRDGWAGHPQGVQLTSDELRFEELAKERGSATANELAAALSRLLNDSVLGPVGKKS